jgi:hypothetical protein
LGQGLDYLYYGSTNFVGRNKGDILRLNEKQKQLLGDKEIRELYPEYHLIKVNSFDDIATNTIDEWIYFLKNEDIKPEFRAKGIQKAKKEFDIMDLSESEQKAYKNYLEDLHYAASMHESTYVLGFIQGKNKEREQAEAEMEILKQEVEAEKQRLLQESERLLQEAEAEKQGLKQETERLLQEAEAEKYAFKKEIAQKCLQMGMSIEQAAQMSGLSTEEIQKII